LPARIAESKVLVTGATGGIGHAIARTLHARGAELVLSGRKVELLGELAAELGNRVETAPADLAAASDVAALAERCAGVDVLVANAGLPGTGTIGSFSAQEIDRALDVNLRAPMQLTRALLPAMVANGAGHVVLISSLVGRLATAYSSVYCATKFGLRGFGLALYEELHGTGVGVTIVLPGFVRDAGLFAVSGAKLPRLLGTSSPKEVADAVVTGIEKGKAEIDVAPFAVRTGSRVLAAAPTIGSAIRRTFGGDKIAEQIAEGQRNLR
jgi:uncharacterized protein